MKENFFEEEFEACNVFVVKFLKCLVVCILTAWILNQLDIFILDKNTISKVVALCSLITIMPVIVYRLNKKARGLPFAYYAATSMVIMIVIAHSVVTMNVTLMYAVPAAVFSLYGTRKLMYYVMSISALGMIVSHLMLVQYSIVPKEPYTTYYTVIIFSLLPKLIIFQAFIYIFRFETKHNNKIIKKMYNYSNKLHTTQEELIISFAQMCESKSDHTGKHVKRVSKYATILGEKLGLTMYECECLSIASMMHDVGKLNISSDILEKKGKLTEEEFTVMKEHTKMGYDLIKDSPGHIMKMASEIALNHHEKWNGSGYHGQKGEEIHIYSRIMALVDIFDALVSVRPYKDKWTPSQAYEEIVSQSGIMFDPKVVEAFKETYPKFLAVLDEMGD